MQDRRNEQRRRTYLGGEISFDRGQARVNCVVRNLSEVGAKIDLPSTVAIPAEFDIAIRHQMDRRRAWITWRTEAAVGISFVEAEQRKPPAPSTVVEFIGVEADRHRLARRIAQVIEPRRQPLPAGDSTRG